MQIAGLLLNQMLQFFLMMLMGFVVVRAGLLKPQDSRVISVLCVYVVLPCVIVNAFQIEYTAETLQGLLLAFAASTAMHLVYLVLIALFGRLCKLDPVEKASVMYSNAGNMIVPVVLAVLGPEWVLYSSAYMSVQIVLQWTHCKALLCGEKGFEWKKVLTNVNILAILAGIALFALNLRLPPLLTGTLSAVGAAVGPMGMMIMGMLVAGCELKKVFRSPRVYLSAALRLLALPAITLALIVVSGAARLLPDADMVLFVSFLACTTPAAATTTLMAQVYGCDAEYASALNVVTTVLCLATMPLMTGLYWLAVG